MAPLRFSANVSWLFPELPGLPARLRAAGSSGFEAAEVAWPYTEPPEALARTAREAGLRLVLINTPPGAPRARGGGRGPPGARGREPGLRTVLSAGDREKGEMGLGAVPGRQAAFREGLEQAVLYAKALGCPRYPVLSSSPSCPVSSKTLPHVWGLGENARLERFGSQRTGSSPLQPRSFVNCLLYFICPVSFCLLLFHAGIPCQELTSEVANIRSDPFEGQWMAAVGAD